MATVVFVVLVVVLAAAVAWSARRARPVSRVHDADDDGFVVGGRAEEARRLAWSVVNTVVLVVRRRAGLRTRFGFVFWLDDGTMATVDGRHPGFLAVLRSSHRLPGFDNALVVEVLEAGATTEATCFVRGDDGDDILRRWRDDGS